MEQEGEEKMMTVDEEKNDKRKIRIQAKFFFNSSMKRVNI